MTKYIVWTKEECIYCEMAKNVLREKGIQFEEKELDEKVNTKKALLTLVPKAKTVPQIFYQGKTGSPIEYVGGYTDLEPHIKNHF